MKNNSYTYPTLTSLRLAFWESHPDLKPMYRKTYRQNDYDTTIRSQWCLFVDSCERNGDISRALAYRATL